MSLPGEPPATSAHFLMGKKKVLSSAVQEDSKANEGKRKLTWTGSTGSSHNCSQDLSSGSSWHRRKATVKASVLGAYQEVGEDNRLAGSRLPLFPLLVESSSMLLSGKPGLARSDPR